MPIVCNYAGTMTTRILALAASLALFAACGGSSSSSTTDAPTTQAPTTTPTTTAPGVSRETVLAVGRCLEEANMGLPLLANLDGTAALDEAKALCEEAGLQADADGAYDLARAIADLELTIAGIGFEVAVSGEIKDAKFQQAMDDLIDQGATVQRLLDEVA